MLGFLGFTVLCPPERVDYGIYRLPGLFLSVVSVMSDKPPRGSEVLVRLSPVGPYHGFYIGFVNICAVSSFRIFYGCTRRIHGNTEIARKFIGLADRPLLHFVTPVPPRSLCAQARLLSRLHRLLPLPIPIQSRRLT